MADYWKSQARKYCDFCKCWISDNQPSIQFHENGKRHKAAVEAKLKAISKKSIADEKARVQMQDDVRKMEEEAMKAYMRDLQQNPDLSSRNGTSSTFVGAYKIAPVEQKKTEWHEAKSPDGEVYYWHSVTGEAKWELPTEGFISLKDQSVKTKATAVNKKPPPRVGKKKDKSKHHKGKRGQGGKMNKSDPEIIPEIMGPVPRGRPFGDWKTVKGEITESVDLQLPEITHKPVKLKRFLDEEEEPELEFKEKTVSSGEIMDGSAGSSGVNFQFKKPKINRGNARQRTSN